MTWWIVAILIVAGVIVADQISKLLVLAHLFEGQYQLIPGVLHFTYVENRGMAFGMLSEHRWVFMLLSVLGIALVGFYMARYVKSTLGRVSLSLIVGGGIGNMIDRVRLGFVVDFIDFCAFDFWVWVFNIADAAVCVGAALFILELVIELVQEIKKKKEPQCSETAERNEAKEHAPKDEDEKNG